MLKDKRRQIIDYVKKHKNFLNSNAQSLDIYEGNLLPYVDDIMQETLSAQYYEKIKERIIPINVLQRYTDKVATVYDKQPQRMSKSENVRVNEFIEAYSEMFSIDVSGQIADQYATLHKGFAWEPYIDNKGKPQLRELAFDKFLVMSDSEVSPEEETLFIKFMGYKSSDADSLLMFVYTDTEFDAFYLNGQEASEYLRDNEGLNPIGVIPFVYGKRQKNRLIPNLDTDMLSITKTIPVMLSDAAGAQMFQCFSLMYGIDVNTENLIMTPNAFWSFKSDNEKKPEIGTVKPQADTEKVLDFVMNIFILWLETKGIRVGSIGSVTGSNLASGISKIIDEMDVYSVKKKSMKWFKKDEEELWNEKLPAIHNYWVQNGLVDPATVPPIMNDLMDVVVEFPAIEPMITRAEEIANLKQELELRTITREKAIRRLHPTWTDEEVQDALDNAEII
jgi:hypothetical protein